MDPVKQELIEYYERLVTKGREIHERICRNCQPGAIRNSKEVCERYERFLVWVRQASLIDLKVSDE
jgi:hypothetical protein